MTAIRLAREVTLERACSRLSVSSDEPLRGTASTVRHWLLVEQPGAWGRDALLESDLPAHVATALKRRAAELGLRLVLIRRPGRRPPANANRSAYVVHSGPDDVWQRRLSFAAATELLDLDLASLMHQSAGATDQPLYLICTHGKHDLCCAVAGIPLARRLRDLGDVWECSHIGGDRFAANLLCLPQGIYYGRVTPEIGMRILERHARGELLLTHLRGRSSYEFAAQAADMFIRQARALHRLDDLALESVYPGSPVECVFRSRSGDSLRVAVDVSSAPPRRLTCHGEATAAPSYSVRWIHA
ncbi:MAG: sucrase ferredoxin [Actinomycetota bacterium]